MVSSIVPGAAGANALGVDTRYQRSTAPAPRREDAANGDRVELSPGALSSARESVRAGVAQVQETLSLGVEAQAMLVKVQGLARSGDQAGLDATLSQYSGRVDAAIGRGAALASGQSVTVQAEPGAPALAIAGADLKLGGDIISVSADAAATDPNLAASAQKSLDTLQTAMSRLADAARSLDAHQGFLNAAEGALNVRADLDADTARLLALQVRQGLEKVGGSPIANVEPQAVLSLFKA